MNSVYIDSAVAASPIYIGPTNANSVIIGNTNSTTTIQGLPISIMAGQPLVAYNVSTGVNANIPTGIEFGSVVENNTNQGGKAYIDFHTNQKGFVDYDARIMAAGGSTVTPATTEASLNYYAASHYFAGNVTINRPLTLGAAPESISHLGFFKSGTTISTTIPASANYLSTCEISQAGIYMASFVCQITGTTLPTGTFYVVLGGGSTINTAYGYTTVNSANLTAHGTQIFKQASSTSITYSLQINYSGGSGLSVQGGSYFNITRIG